jgi:hypothetical protein
MQLWVAVTAEIASRAAVSDESQSRCRMNEKNSESDSAEARIDLGKVG